MLTHLEISADDFDWVRGQADRLVGIQLPPEKKELVRQRLSPLLRRRGLEDFKGYKALFQADDPAVRSEFINALTTNVTSLYREVYHFEHLGDRLAREWRGRRVRLWSAACSSGEEPASIGSVLHSAGVDWSLLCTDVDSNVLLRAARQTFPLPEQWPRREWRQGFQRGTGANQGFMRTRSEAHRRMTFRPLNLKHAWPETGALDGIFCRNVLIYFEPRFQEELVRRLVQRLRVGGVLFLGHSESRLGLQPGLEPEIKTAFRRVA